MRVLLRLASHGGHVLVHQAPVLGAVHPEAVHQAMEQLHLPQEACAPEGVV